MLFRLMAGAGLFVLGYYLGKQIGRMEPIQEELEEARAARAREAEDGGTAESRRNEDEPS